MTDNLQEFFQRFELLAFFAGYPLLYAILYFFGIARKSSPRRQSRNLQELLPGVYAITGTLFVLFLMREIYADHSLEDIAPSAVILMLKIWGVLAILFWIPALRRQPLYSLIHSLVFFLLILKDILTGMGSPTGRDQIRNDMRIFTSSLLLNAGILVIVLVFVILKNRIIRKKSL
jgi:hypothetical protein